MYDLETDRVAEEIARHKARRVLLQLPDGLRPQAFGIAQELRRRTGAEILLSGDSCYGACDLAARQAEAVKADLLVHYGHSRMIPDTGVPVLYVEARMGIDVESLVEKALPLTGGWKRVGLASTVQHVHQLLEVAEALKERDIEAFIGPGDEKAPHPGQVLGCHYGTALSVEDRVDGFLFVGAGRFHPIGLAISTGKPVVAADPYAPSAFRVDEGELRRLAMRRMAGIEAAKRARRIGVLVSLKPGQLDESAAENITKKLEEGGYEAFIICMDEVRGEALGNFTEAEAFVDAACPRIALDGVAGVRRPVLTLQEAQVMLGERRWEDVWGWAYFR